MLATWRAPSLAAIAQKEVMTRSVRPESRV